MSRSPVPLPAAFSRAPFRTEDAVRAGLTPGRLRASDLTAPHRGVRVQGPPDADLRGRCLAVLQALPQGARFGHVTALGLVGVDPPWSLADDRRLHVEVSTAGVRPRIRGVVAHRHVGAAPVIDVAGLPVLEPAVAWTRVGAQLGHVELVVLADALCRRRGPVTTPERLAETVAALPAGTRGVRRLRAAVADCRAGTDSNMETRARLALSSVGIECDVNRPVLDADGRFVALPDLSDHRHRVAIEYDGDVHRTDKRTWRRDIARRQAMEAAGWRVVTITADDVLRGDDRWLSWVRAAQRRQSPSGQ
ncbi:MAG: DUF559 domain-containing protein [Cellulomonas sp.]